MTINLLKAIFISTILVTATTLFVILGMSGLALAKVNVTPSGGTAGGVGLPPMGLGQGGSGELDTPTNGGFKISGGHGSGGGGSGGGGGGQETCTLSGECTLIHCGSGGGKP